MVAATVRVVRKKLVSCKIDVGGVGRWGAVRHRIAPAIGDMFFYFRICIIIQLITLQGVWKTQLGAMDGK